MRRYLLHLSYFGTRYRGFQKQNFGGNPFYEDPHTVCGLLEIALKGCKPTNHPIIFPSSRTDKGVHALCNTVHVDLDGDRTKLTPDAIVEQLNRFFEYNDHDIRVLKVQRVADDFHCRYKAYERRYLYRFAVPRLGVPLGHRFLRPWPLTELNRCYFSRDPKFDAEAVKSACSIFVGLKDFRALRANNNNNEERSTLRELKSLELVKESPFISNRQLEEEFDFWHFTCSARSFLYHQVRRMVTALLTYGQGRVSLADVQRLIDEPVDESWTVFSYLVPSHGLYLLDVLYKAEDLNFVPELTDEELRVNELKDEQDQIYKQLKNFNGTVVQKINLKQRLLDIKKRLSYS